MKLETYFVKIANIMPMYYGDIELELDSVEKRGAGRVPQEMAKSGGSGGPIYPEGIPSGLLRYKMEKTQRAVGARITQVRRGKER
jgi:hypothetical protein